MQSAKVIKALIFITALGVLGYLANYAVSTHAVPSLQEFMDSSTDLVASSTDTTSTQSLDVPFDTATSSTIALNTSNPTTGVIYGIFRAPQASFRVTTAKTPTTREKGLSGRDSLAPDEGLLFIFPTSQVSGFWMKDMKFPIDIIWIDSNRKVVTVAENILPETYPKSFYPTKKAQFVLEVNAGSAKKSGLVEGTTVVF